MAIKNIILLSLILLMVSGTSINANCSSLGKYKKPIPIELNMDIFSLLRLLDASQPLSRQKITDIGFELAKIKNVSTRGEYAVPSVVLTDGVVLNHIILETRDVEAGKHIYFFLSIKNKVITRQELERHLGEFVVLPRDHMRAEVSIYDKTTGSSHIHAIYTREPKNILLNVSFSSVEPLEQ